jgi:hypothetical protein
LIDHFLKSMEIEMQFIVAMLVLLIWVEVASAQKEYSLSVSRHAAVPPLSVAEVSKILADASRMLQINPGHACNVKFTLKGSIGIFGSPNTSTANIPAKVNADHIDAVHSVDSNVDTDFHVKVVEEIKPLCVGPEGAFHGCAFPHRFRSIIVVHPLLQRVKASEDGPEILISSGVFGKKFPDHLLWAHEFGHLTGLDHRVTVPPMEDQDGCTGPTDSDRCALMRKRDIFSFAFEALDSVQVSKAECDCFLSGPTASDDKVCPQPLTRQ